MAGAFAAIVRAPITGIILIAEMSGTLTNLLPLAVVSLISYLCASLLNCEPIYESLLHNLLVKNGVNLSAFHGAVSYTHLDVYKRQISSRAIRMAAQNALKKAALPQ